jgi:long-chain acyl-CoA synthetase
VYRQSSLVGNICVFASGDRARPVAIVLPSSTALQKLAEENTVQEDSLSDLVRDERVQAFALKELQSAGRKAGLANFEIIDGVVLTAFEWTIQNVSSNI